jgi:hypothetical protein
LNIKFHPNLVKFKVKLEKIGDNQGRSAAAGSEQRPAWGRGLGLATHVGGEGGRCRWPGARLGDGVGGGGPSRGRVGGSSAQGGRRKADDGEDSGRHNADLGRWGVVGGARRRPAAGPIWWRWRNEDVNLCGVHYAACSEERSKRAATKFLKAWVSRIHSLVN